MTEFIELLEIEQRGHEVKVIELLKWGAALLIEIDARCKRIEEIKAQIDTLAKMDPIPESDKVRKNMKLYALGKV